MTTSSLTSQIDAIKTTLATLLEADRKDEALEMFVTVLSQLATDHDRLQHQLRLLLKNRFGRKTEKIDPAQLRLFLEELRQAAAQGDAPAADAARPVVAHVRRKPIERRGRRPALPESLPREVVRLEPGEAERTCSCGAAKTCIGCETSQVLELVPAQFKVLVYERAKYACRRCEAGVVIAPAPVKPIDGGLPGFGLLADVLVKKYAEHLPLHRIREIYRRHGPEIAVSTLADWVAAGAEALEPIAAEIRKTGSGLLCRAGGRHAVDRARQPEARRVETRLPVGVSWGLLVGGVRLPADARGAGPWAFLGLREAWVQADAAGAFDPLFALGRAQEAGCWSHW